MMDPRLICAGIGFWLGCSLGAATGVAAAGDAVNGAVIFGPIGGALGFLVGRRSSPPGSTDETIDGSFDGGTRDPMSRTGRDADSVLEAVLKLMGSIWSLQMLLLVAAGVMPIFRKHPWLFAPMGILMLAFAFPVGVVFAATGFAAVHFEVKAADNFVVQRSR